VYIGVCLAEIGNEAIDHLGEAAPEIDGIPETQANRLGASGRRRGRDRGRCEHTQLTS
jgi:hypothetical protein